MLEMPRLFGKPLILSVEAMAVTIRRLINAEEMTMEPLAAIRELGLPVVALLAIGAGIWRVCEWLGREVIIPLRNRHLGFLDSLAATLKTLADTQESMAHEISVISDSISTRVRSKKENS
jgi:hypothetical protein